MTIYETVGYSQPLHAYDKKPPFRYLKEFKPILVPKGVKIDDYKRQQAPSPEPSPVSELDNTFRSIVKSEKRKRGG